MPVKTVFLVITGRVQGVGFRYFVRHKAKELKIFGWVRNTSEGWVEIEAEGDSRQVDVFIDWMKIGPPAAIVKNVSFSEITPLRNFTHFYIL